MDKNKRYEYLILTYAWGMLLAPRLFQCIYIHLKLPMWLLSFFIVLLFNTVFIMCTEARLKSNLDGHVDLELEIDK